MNAVANKYNLKEVLFELLLNKHTISKLNYDLHEIILQFGSETPDNINCAKKVGFGKDDNTTTISNFGLIKNGVIKKSYKTLFNNLKEDIPTPLFEIFPAITFKEYKRVINLTYDVFSDLTTDCSFLQGLNLMLKKFSFRELEKSKGLFQSFTSSNGDRIRRFNFKSNLFYDTFEKRKRFGFSFKFGDQILLISDFWREMECIDVPENLHDLTVSEWEALNRFIVLLTLELEK